jgi:hypothetical protein
MPRIHGLLQSALIVAVTCGLTEPVHSQSLTGTIVGAVQDSQGGAVQDATVRLASDSLIGGEARTTSTARGQLRFPVLAPGIYTLDVEKAGFQPYHEEGLVVGAGATLQRTVVLQAAGIAESVVVEGSGSRIDARTSGVETRIGQDYLTHIPARRFSMFDSLRAVPGVSPTSPSSGTVNTISAFGSGVNENLFLIDGTNFTCPCAGISRAEPSVDVIQEVQVQSIGVSAEFGNIQGSVVNVVTRQGGDQFRGDLSYYGQPAALTSQPIVRPVPDTGTSSGYERIEYRDGTANLGGPVKRDHVWFFAGYQYLRDYDSQPATDPAHPRIYEQNKGFGKLSWRLTPTMQLMQSWHGEKWINPDRPTFVAPFETTTRSSTTVHAITFGDFTQTLSQNTVLNARAGSFGYDQDYPPSTGDTTTPSHFDHVTGVASDAPPSFGELTLGRITAKAMLTHYRPSLFGADHELKGGAQFERGQHEMTSIIPGGVRYSDINGQPYQSQSAAPSVSGGRFDTFALFASDTINAGPRLTLNLGLRFDHATAISQDLNAIDGAGNPTSEIVHGLGTLYTWNVFSPRLGVVERLTADGRTILRASYGRFNQGVLTGELAQVHPGVSTTTTRAFDPATGDYTHVISVLNPTKNLRIDSSMRTPHTDEFSAGVDREIGSRLQAAVAYIHKSGRDFIGFTDIAGQYVQQTHVLPDGSTLPVYVLTSPASSRLFFQTNPDGYFLTYNGLVTVIEKRRSNGWQALGSYTLSRTTGLMAASSLTAADAQASSVGGPFGTAAFGRDPNSLTNADGRLPNDRPHMFRLAGSYDINRIGVTLSGNFQYFVGKPWAETAQVSLPQGDQRILLELRGARRLSSQSLLDLRVAKTISIGRLGRAEAMLDVLNLLNDTAEEALATDNRFSPNLGVPTVFIDPRRVMLGVRVNLGT